MREEIDSPFRTLRVVLFGFSTVSALVALYFSLLTLGKTLGGFPDATPLDIAGRDAAVNVAALTICGLLTWRDMKAGEANLERIARGGQLAALRVAPADGSPQRALNIYRGDKRLLIAAGGEAFITDLAASVLTVADDLVRVNVVVVPVLLESDHSINVDKGRQLWRDAQQDDSLVDTANRFVNFPVLAAPWLEYLAPEIDTARNQGFNPVDKGLGIYVKKNGRILRRATGLPNWNQFLGTMDLMDGKKK